MADEAPKVEIAGTVKVEAVDPAPGVAMGTLQPPITQKTVETKETTVGPPSPPPPPAVIADDASRKWLALVVIAQFLGLIGYWIYVGKPIDNIQMVLGAEIGFVTTVLNYYFGSSSGSTAKSAVLERK